MSEVPEFKVGDEVAVYEYSTFDRIATIVQETATLVTIDRYGQPQSFDRQTGSGVAEYPPSSIRPATDEHRRSLRYRLLLDQLHEEPWNTYPLATLEKFVAMLDKNRERNGRMNVAEEMVTLAEQACTLVLVRRSGYRKRLERKWLPKMLRRIRRAANNGQFYLYVGSLDADQTNLVEQLGFRVQVALPWPSRQEDRIEW